MSKTKIPRIPEKINFVEEEQKVLEFWQQNKIFELSALKSYQNKRYSFYDGPPFATGLPHYGHILAGTIKDVVCRYAYQTGLSVERRFGWDCHGLPIEFEIDKLLNIKSPDQVYKMGIEKYNNECRKIVSRYSNEWNEIITRLGRWIDFENDYKTMYSWYMESIWWVFKQLYVKGFVYQGVKVMPYSIGCSTPLSNFESGLNYRDVVDPSVFILFPLKERKEVFFLVWTTTPWTLPSNLALCVNPNLIYLEVFEMSTNRILIFAESRLDHIFTPNNFEYQVTLKYPGSKLKDIEYIPVFDYFRKGRVFKVLNDNYVTDDAGTGIVHQAPYFGEDDYRVCLANGVITKDQDPICPLDDNSCFTKEVTDLDGIGVKAADPIIINKLKEKKLLFRHSQIKHSYPFCWRSDTPLIYRAVKSWFIRVEHMREELIEANSKTFWVPEFVKEKRFGNWLKDAHDWAISRNRFWGTPIPIWISDDGQEVVCVSSKKELSKLIGRPLETDDLHRENIDHLEIPSKRPNHGPLKRISSVFDCWFESGCMPYAEHHYPFENKKKFDELFPADFIGEGIDQTRGWFYTLLIISTALFKQAPFKNLIANGLVLAADGQKMSKRKKNYPNPVEIINEYGSDALRLYLISSPVVRAENLRFNDKNIRDIVRDVFIPWFNSFRFLFQNIEIFVNESKQKYTFNENFCTRDFLKQCTIMDRWILSYMQSLIDYVSREMHQYHLYNVLPKLTAFFEQLTNWYIRMNRQRLKGVFGSQDCVRALTTLNKVLIDLVKLMAPFTPFITEYMFKHLRFLMTNSVPKLDSIHFKRIPNANHGLINIDIERSVLRMQTVIELGRILRDRKTIPVKYPLNEIVIIHSNDQYLSDIELLEQFILTELNCRKLTLSKDRNKYNVKIRAEPDFKVLGSRLKSDLATVTAAIKKLNSDDIDLALRNGSVKISEHVIKISELRLIYFIDKNAKINGNFEANSDNDVLILLEMTVDKSMNDEGMSREIINRVQKLRKKAGLVPLDEIIVYFETKSDELISVIEYFRENIEQQIKAKLFYKKNFKKFPNKIIEESFDMKNDRHLEFILCWKNDPSSKSNDDDFVQIELVDLPLRYGNTSNTFEIKRHFFENGLKLSELKDEIERNFGIYNINFNISTSNHDLIKDDVVILDSSVTKLYVIKIR